MPCNLYLFSGSPLPPHHVKEFSIVPDAEIPAFYAIAMAVDALVALVTGRAYDRYWVRVLVLMPILGLAIPVVAFSHSYSAALAGSILWGASMGMQEAILRAAVADFTPPVDGSLPTGSSTPSMVVHGLPGASLTGRFIW